MKASRILRHHVFGHLLKAVTSLRFDDWRTAGEDHAWRSPPFQFLTWLWVETTGTILVGTHFRTYFSWNGPGAWAGIIANLGTQQVLAKGWLLATGVALAFVRGPETGSNDRLHRTIMCVVSERKPFPV